MKNFYLLLLLLSSTIVSAQENCISTSLDHPVDTIQTYGSILSAQCDNCYYWEISNGSATIIGDNTTSSIQVLRSGTGSFTITLTKFINGDCIECNIVIPGGCRPPTLNICNQITSVNQNGELILQLSQYESQPVRYVWQATYLDNTTATYDSANPPPGTNVNINYFSAQFYAIQSNPIKSVRVTSYKLGCPNYRIIATDSNCPNSVYAGNFFTLQKDILKKENDLDIYYENKQPIISTNLEKQDIVAVVVFDLSGTIVEKFKDLNSLQLGSMKSGLYILQVQTKDKTLSKKFIINK
ncbi:T9SS type A sorting domain-containing protein [Nonlabens sp. SY33080]|uniref:T9SS type A sorting domain-containing protein n=1 Tax=Nonlabens sp. SY33080 TaxID=2719911 RepID=UPI001428C567|nr:T9SS type A sorting domain-containing protein [Nonlabens sp. SY33080]